jgi:hypothetical protein
MRNSLHGFFETTIGPQVYRDLGSIHMKKLIFIISLLACNLAYPQQVQLLDAFTGFPLSKTNVTITRKNTIRCASAPCPSNETKYDLVSNPTGIINVGTLYSNQNLGGNFEVCVSHYHQLIIPKNLNSQGLNKLELVPIKIDSSFRQITFVNKINNEPLADLEVNFSRVEKECHNSDCPGTFFKAKTNTLGHIYYKFLLAFPNGLNEMKPIWFHTKDYLPHVRHHHHDGKVQLIPKNFM